MRTDAATRLPDMIIVSGKLYVETSARDGYLEGCRTVVERARQAPGCIDFHLSPDPLEEGRINIFEQWESVSDAEAFRGSGPSDDQTAAILEAKVAQHRVASSEFL